MDFVVGLDLGHPNVPSADRWILSVIAPLTPASSLIACTHVVSSPYPHVAISIVGSGPSSLLKQLASITDHHGRSNVSSLSASGPDTATRPWPAGSPTSTASKVARGCAAQAITAHIQGTSGRAVIYPGVERLSGAMRIEEIVASSAITRVVLFDGASPGSVEPPADAKLDTRDHVRPCWSRGLLTLLVMPAAAAAGAFVPFEGPYPGSA